MINYNFNGLKRISKPMARKKFEQGEKIRFCTCRMNPTNLYGIGYIDIEKNEDMEDFEKICNSFMYYNCTNEAGRYISFYIFD